MSRAATWIFPAFALSVEAFAQVSLTWPPAQNLASPGWPFGPPRSHVSFEGILARSDGETLSIELPDQRTIRFQLDSQTRYRPDAPEQGLAAFHVADLVHVDSDVDSNGDLVARSVSFIRKASPNEQSEILQSPEVMQRWRRNVLGSNAVDQGSDDRKLSLVAKPHAIAEPVDVVASALRRNESPSANHKEGEAPQPRPIEDDDLISSVRKSVNEAFDRLPNLRAKQVTSVFHSTSKRLKWIPDSVVAAEVAYEGGREFYNNIHVDGKRPADAPDTVDSDYMRSRDKAWSTGDFETIAHCIFSELDDSDFRRVRAEDEASVGVVAYEFTGGRSSACIGVKYRSEVVYPSFKGLLKLRATTREVLHVELEATEMPTAFPLDRAERSVDFGSVHIGAEQFLLPTTAYWFGCFRNSYSCFMNRIDFRDYRLFQADSTVRFGN